MRIFGREPTAILYAIQTILALLVTFNLNGLSSDQAGLWVAIISAIFSALAAWQTRPVTPQVFTGVINALAALTAGYGLDWGAERIGAVNLVLTAVLALLTRQQVSPTPDAPRTGVLGNKVTVP